MNKTLAYSDQQRIEAMQSRVQSLVVQLNRLYSSARALEIELPGVDNLKELFIDIRTGNYLLPLSRQIRDSKFRTEKLITDGNTVLKELASLRAYVLQSSDNLVIINTEALESFFDTHFRLFTDADDAAAIQYAKELANNLQKINSLRERESGRGYSLFSLQENTILSQVLSKKSII